MSSELDGGPLDLENKSLQNLSRHALDRNRAIQD